MAATSKNGKTGDSKVTVLNDGIRVDLGGGYWILYSKEWDSLDNPMFRAVTNLDALKLVIQHALDWHFPNHKWEDIPFDRDALVAAIEQAQWGAANPSVILSAIALLDASYAAENTESIELALETLRTQHAKAIETITNSAVPRYPVQLETPLIESWYKANAAAHSLPFPTPSPVGA